jgi:hypothetical protein
LEHKPPVHRIGVFILCVRFFGLVTIVKKALTFSCRPHVKSVGK